MRVRLISVPYDSGQRDFRMGAGPGALLAWGLEDRIASSGHEVATAVVEAPTAAVNEVDSGFALCGRVAHAVRAAVQEGEFPIVLTGNCLIQVGVIAGLSPGTIGVVWLDAHGDLNTPATSASGFLDGMALSVVMGACWQDEAKRVDGFTPVDPRSVALIGARDLDPPERQIISLGTLRHVHPSETRGTDWVQPIVSAMSSRNKVSVHLDLDVLDPDVCPVNALQAPDGFTVDETLALLRGLAADRRVAALTVSAYDPEVDPRRSTPPVVARLVKGVIESATSTG